MSKTLNRAERWSGVSNQWCPQQETSQTGNTCSHAKHGKQMASTRPLSVQCNMEVEGGGGWRKIQKKKWSGWMISGHLSALQQGVTFKRAENSLPLFLQIWSLQQIADNNCAFASPGFDSLCNQIPQRQLHNGVYFNIPRFV